MMTLYEIFATKYFHATYDDPDEVIIDDPDEDEEELEEEIPFEPEPDLEEEEGH